MSTRDWLRRTLSVHEGVLQPVQGSSRCAAGQLDVFAARERYHGSPLEAARHRNNTLRGSRRTVYVIRVRERTLRVRGSPLGTARATGHGHDSLNHPRRTDDVTCVRERPVQGSPDRRRYDTLKRTLDVTDLDLRDVKTSVHGRPRAVATSHRHPRAVDVVSISRTCQLRRTFDVKTGRSPRADRHSTRDRHSPRADRHRFPLLSDVHVTATPPGVVAMHRTCRYCEVDSYRVVDGQNTEPSCEPRRYW